jgi:hypothetical protein
MLDFNSNTQGFAKILTRIANNYDGGKHTHKEARAYARCLLQVLSEITIDFNVKPEVQILLTALTVYGLPHYSLCFFSRLHFKTIRG